MLGLGEQSRLLVAGAWAHTGGDGACRLCPQLAWPARPRPHAIGHAQAGRAWSLALRAVGGRGPYSRGAERSEHHTGGRRESTRTSNAQREVREAARVPEGAKKVFITTAHATRESEALEDQMSNVRLSVRQIRVRDQKFKPTETRRDGIGKAIANAKAPARGSRGANEEKTDG
jgi:hypothetical protein